MRRWHCLLNSLAFVGSALLSQPPKRQAHSFDGGGVVGVAKVERLSEIEWWIDCCCFWPMKRNKQPTPKTTSYRRNKRPDCWSSSGEVGQGHLSSLLSLLLSIFPNLMALSKRKKKTPRCCCCSIFSEFAWAMNVDWVSPSVTKCCSVRAGTRWRC